ncbi:MAG: hypothetical protein U0793_05355 [Gemmataceae bacterium]
MIIRTPARRWPGAGAANALPPHVWLLDMHRRSFAGEGAASSARPSIPSASSRTPTARTSAQAITPPAKSRSSRFGARRGLLEQVQRQADGVLGRRLMDAHQSAPST